jgi:hypothetical protein
VVPGFPGYVYDPVASNASGRKVFRANPKAQIDEQQAAKDAQQEQLDLQKQQSSPMGQITPVLAGTGGILLANQLMSSGIGKPPAQAINVDAKTGNVLFNDGTLKAPNGDILSGPKGTAPVGSPQANAAAQGANAPGQAEAPTPPPGVVPATVVGSATMPDGSPGIQMSDGAIVADSGAMVTPEGEYVPPGKSNWGGYIQAAGGAAQAYSGYKQYQDGQKLAGGANMLGGAYNAYSGLSGNFASAAPYVGAAVGAANVGQNVMDTEGNSEDRAAASQAEAAKAALLFIPVYGQAAYAALAGLDAVSGGKATEGIGKLMGASNKLTDKIDFGLGKSIRGKLFHQSTRGIAKENSAKLMQASDDPTYQNYVAGMREQYNSDPLDPTKPFAGKYASWDEYKKGGLEAADLTGVYGNIKAYGPAWASLTQDQRQAVTQANIDSGIYNSKKGEVEITDEQKAKENFDNVMKGFKVGAQAAAQGAATPVAPGLPAKPVMTPGVAPVVPTGNPLAAAAAQGARSKSRSPGIGLDGRRINY